MDKDKELPVVVRLFCGGLAGGISQTGKSGISQTVKSGISKTGESGFPQTGESGISKTGKSGINCCTTFSSNW